jgi:hypothetical protein
MQEKGSAFPPDAEEKGPAFRPALEAYNELVKIRS